MAYYVLTDPVRKGEVILVDKRKHFRFVFGSYQWERTTLFQAYLTQGTPFFRRYQEVTDKDAMELLKQKAARVLKMMEDAKAAANTFYAGKLDCYGQPFLKHILEEADTLTDMEEKIAALLQDVCRDAKYDEHSLIAQGFSPMISQAAVLLAASDSQPYGNYLAALRSSRIARNVKLVDLSWVMEACRDKDQKAKVKAARQFLYGDIPQYSGSFDEMAVKFARASMVPAMQVYNQITPKAFFGRKVPHGISNPVIRLWNGKPYLAFFVYTYTREELQRGDISRPATWMLAELDSGKPVQEFVCRERDFSSAQPDLRCSTQIHGAETDRSFFSGCYATLDYVRKQWLTTGVFQWQEYNDYLMRVLKAVPQSYHRFYWELSLSEAEANGISKKAGV